MSHLKIKQIAGPSNGKQGSVIVFEDAPKWSTDLSTALQLPTGTQAQRPETPAAGMMRFNSDISAVEFSDGDTWKRLDPDLSIYLQRYTFRVNLKSDNTIASVVELPSNWQLVGFTDTTVTINSGQGRPPAGGYMYGLVSLSGDRYQMRNFSGAVEIEYNVSNQDIFVIQGITSQTVIGTVTGGHTYFHVYI